jgi:uncharacterized protein (DUF427 family)
VVEASDQYRYRTEKWEGRCLVRAIWNGEIIAQATIVEKLDGATYFPPQGVQWRFMQLSTTTTYCPLKGVATHYTLVVNGNEGMDAAWSYDVPTPGAARIKRHIAFSPDIRIIE